MGFLKTESEHDRAQREWREVTLPKLKADAEAMIPEVLAEQPKRLAEFEAALDADRGTYEFRCERWGDFLALFVKRGLEPDVSMPKWQRSRNHIVCAVNLADSQMVSLKDGSGPDLGASCVLHYSEKYESDGKFSRYVIHKTYPVYGRSSGRMIYVNTPPSQSNFNQVSTYGGIGSMGGVYIESFGSGGSGGGGGGGSGGGGGGGSGGCVVGQSQAPLTSAIQGCAQHADDDQIIFAGAGVALYVPFGRGQEIYESVLQEIKTGAASSVV